MPSQMLKPSTGDDIPADSKPYELSQLLHPDMTVMAGGGGAGGGGCGGLGSGSGGGGGGGGLGLGVGGCG